MPGEFLFREALTMLHPIEMVYFIPVNVTTRTGIGSESERALLADNINHNQRQTNPSSRSVLAFVV